MNRLVRRIAASVLALGLLVPVAATPVAACTTRSALTQNMGVSLRQPTGAYGSTWFQGVEASVEIKKPAIYSGWARYGITLYSTYNQGNGWLPVATSAYYVYPNGTMQWRIFATNAYGNTVLDLWYGVGTPVAGSVHPLKIVVEANGVIAFWKDNVRVNAVQPTFTWKGTDVQVESSISNRANYLAGTGGNPQNWSNIKYTTQYGTAAFASGATSISNSATAYFGATEPAGGQFVSWDRYC